MRNANTFILLLISMGIFAHEDTYKAIQLSNLHLKVMVGYEDSYQLKIAESYAPIINDFIKDIDSTKKVFIQFEEDYCSLKNEYFLLSIDSLRNSLIPLGFPFSYPYDLGFVKSEYGLNLIISQINFKLKPILKLISFGLENQEYVNKNQKHFKFDSENMHPVIKSRMSRDISKRIKSIDIPIVDSLINCENTEKIVKYLGQRVSFSKSTIDKYGIRVTLLNDSIIVNDNLGKTILKIEGIQYIAEEKDTNGVFIFDTDRSFYFIDNKLKTSHYINNLTFGIKSKCRNIVFITYDSEQNVFEISNGYSGNNRITNYFDMNKGMVEMDK